MAAALVLVAAGLVAVAATFGVASPDACFYRSHRSFLVTFYGAAGVPQEEVDRNRMSTARGGTFPQPVGVTTDDVVRALGPPDSVAAAGPGGDIPCPPGAWTVMYYRDGDAVGCFVVDAAGIVLGAYSYDVAYFQ